MDHGPAADPGGLLGAKFDAYLAGVINMVGGLLIAIGLFFGLFVPEVTVDYTLLFAAWLLGRQV
jgi:hypothetical protein